MTYYQTNKEKYVTICQFLSKKAERKNDCPIYELGVKVNQSRYTLFVLPERAQKVYAFYAIRRKDNQKLNVTEQKTITDNNLLMSLMHLSFDNINPNL